jgi:hypothetical protein
LPINSVLSIRNLSINFLKAKLKYHRWNTGKRLIIEGDSKKSEWISYPFRPFYHFIRKQLYLKKMVLLALCWQNRFFPAGFT